MFISSFVLIIIGEHFVYLSEVLIISLLYQESQLIFTIAKGKTDTSFFPCHIANLRLKLTMAFDMFRVGDHFFCWGRGVEG